MMHDVCVLPPYRDVCEDASKNRIRQRRQRTVITPGFFCQAVVLFFMQLFLAQTDFFFSLSTCQPLVSSSVCWLVS